MQAAFHPVVVEERRFPVGRHRTALQLDFAYRRAGRGREGETRRTGSLHLQHELLVNGGQGKGFRYTAGRYGQRSRPFGFERSHVLTPDLYWDDGRLTHRTGEDTGISRTARFVYPDRGRSRYRPILQRVAVQDLLPIEERHLLQFRREVIPRKGGIEQEVVHADGQIGNPFAYLRTDELLRRRVTAGNVDSPLDIPLPDIDAFAGERAEVGRNQPVEVAELGIDIIKGNVRRINPAQEPLVSIQAGKIDGALAFLVRVVSLPGKGHETHRIRPAYLLEGERPGRGID